MLRGLSSDGREACARDLALQDHGATTASLSQSGCQFIEHSENQSVSWQGTAGVGDDFVVSQRDSHNLLRSVPPALSAFCFFFGVCLIRGRGCGAGRRRWRVCT